jgi:phage-related protein
MRYRLKIKAEACEQLRPLATKNRRSIDYAMHLTRNGEIFIRVCV